LSVDLVESQWRSASEHRVEERGRERVRDVLGSRKREVSGFATTGPKAVHQVSGSAGVGVRIRVEKRDIGTYVGEREVSCADEVDSVGRAARWQIPCPSGRRSTIVSCSDHHERWKVDRSESLIGKVAHGWGDSNDGPHAIVGNVLAHRVFESGNSGVRGEFLIRELLESGPSPQLQSLAQDLGGAFGVVLDERHTFGGR
jgi:hypothetical protein